MAASSASQPRYVHHGVAAKWPAATTPTTNTGGPPSAKMAKNVMNADWNHVLPRRSTTREPGSADRVVTWATTHGLRRCHHDSRKTVSERAISTFPSDPFKKPLALAMAVRAASASIGLWISRVSLHHGFNQSGRRGCALAIAPNTTKFA